MPGEPEDMRSALHDVLQALTREQLERASLPFSAQETRTAWAYYPRPEPGISLASLNSRQQKVVMRLLRSGLSFEAFARTQAIIALENVLDELEGRGWEVRDPANYSLCLFMGEGLRQAVRGWRFQGHHISVNYTLDRGGIVSASPLFLGANPARVAHGGYDILRPVGDAEDRGFELLDALSPGQRAKAIVHEVAPHDLVLGDLPLPSLAEDGTLSPFQRDMLARWGRHESHDVLAYRHDRPLGIAAGDLTPGQRELLARLLAVYTGRFPEGAKWEGIESLDELHFAWAGPAAPAEGGHYYRLQGPAVVIEYDNTQDGANHAHTVCRHPANDFAAATLDLHHLLAHAANQ